MYVGHRTGAEAEKASGEVTDFFFFIGALRLVFLTEVIIVSWNFPPLTVLTRPDMCQDPRNI